MWTAWEAQGFLWCISVRERDSLSPTSPREWVTGSWSHKLSHVSTSSCMYWIIKISSNNNSIITMQSSHRQEQIRVLNLLHPSWALMMLFLVSSSVFHQCGTFSLWGVFGLLLCSYCVQSLSWCLRPSPHCWWFFLGWLCALKIFLMDSGFSVYSFWSWGYIGKRENWGHCHRYM